uniref:SKP1 component POZ domain-containing protein n=1 Tax=Rhinolophus ferrumequinum TaxID=59479 RepID=A0A671DPY2_RHIFE
MPSINLQSSDGEISEVDVEIAKHSVTIKTMLKDFGMDDDPVPLLNVNAAIFKKVIHQRPILKSREGHGQTGI